MGAAGCVQISICLSTAGRNAYFRVNPAAGTSNNLLELVVKAHSNQGIAVKTLICTNYGIVLDFPMGTDATKTEVRPFRWDLDKY